MNFKDRLSRLASTPGLTGNKTPSPVEVSDLRRRIEAVIRRTRQPQPHQGPPGTGTAVLLEHAVGGEEAVTSHGRFFYAMGRLGRQDRHGKKTIAELAQVDMRGVGVLGGDPSLGDLGIEHALFIDTETTGLAGGTGTFPFLVGLGWFEGSSFVTCQLFARDFSEERAMLAHLGEIAGEKRFLVSFNGKSFDLNILAARFVLNRVHDEVSSLPHLDLLHPGRRLLGSRLENVRLSTIEACVLGVERGRDIEGAEIPSRYFAWLRRRDGSLMTEVFRHNRLDVVSMASLLKHLGDLVCGGADPDATHASDILEAARINEDRGDLARACALYERAACSGDPSVARRSRMRLSLIHKRAGRWKEALAIWECMLAVDPPDLFAAEEIAKYLEHHARDYDAALKIVCSALEQASTLAPSDRDGWRRRIERLARKLSVGGFQGAPCCGNDGVYMNDGRKGEAHGEHHQEDQRTRQVP